MPESQAEVQAELMAEAFGFYADNLLTKDHFTEVLNARFAEQGAKLERSLSALESRMDQRFNRQDVTQRVLAWMVGLITVAVVLPQLQAWLA